jgi:glycerol kinase
MNKFQQSGKVKIIKGSILSPQNAGLRFVLSVNNLAGKQENPLFPIFDKKWKKVREDSRGWFATKTGAYKLGALFTTAVQSDTWVIHMLCQDEKFVTDKEALASCLKQVAASAKYEKATVHVSTLLTEAMPELSSLLTEQLIDTGVSVYFYEEIV